MIVFDSWLNWEAKSSCSPLVLGHAGLGLWAVPAAVTEVQPVPRGDGCHGDALPPSNTLTHGARCGDGESQRPFRRATSLARAGYDWLEQQRPAVLAPPQVQNPKMHLYKYATNACCSFWSVWLFCGKWQLCVCSFALDYFTYCCLSLTTAPPAMPLVSALPSPKVNVFSFCIFTLQYYKGNEMHKWCWIFFIFTWLQFIIRYLCFSEPDSGCSPAFLHSRPQRPDTPISLSVRSHGLHPSLVADSKYY